MATDILDIYFDCETTGINPYTSEIITAYFMVFDCDKFIDSYHLKSQVNFWSDDAEIIHKITHQTMLSYPKKDNAFRGLLQWLPSNFRFITYTNKNTELGVINFDVAILENELNLLGCPNYYLKNKYKMQPAISVHDIARECVRKDLFRPLKRESGRANLSQSGVYKALFDDEYDAHNEVADVNALVKIHNRLLQLQNENTTLI